MTPTETNIAVAEKLGWEKVKDTTTGIVASTTWSIPPRGVKTGQLPDFYHSLDACKAIVEDLNKEGMDNITFSFCKDKIVCHIDITEHSKFISGEAPIIDINNGDDILQAMSAALCKAYLEVE